MEEIKYIVKGAGINFIGYAVGGILAYISTFLIARFFGAEKLGLFNIGFSLTTVFGLFALLGLHEGVSRYVSIALFEKDGGRIRSIISFARKTTICSSTIFLILQFLLAGFLANTIFHSDALSPIIRIFAFLIPLVSLEFVYFSSFVALKKINYGVIIRYFLIKILFISFITICIIAGFSIKFVVISYIISYALSMILSHYMLNKTLRSLKDGVIKKQIIKKEIISFSIPLFFSSIVFYALNNMDNLILGYFRPAAEVGIYNIIMGTSLFLAIGLSSFLTIYGPMAASLHSQRKIAKLRQVYSVTTKWLFSMAWPGFLLLVLFGEKILLLFGNEVGSGTIALIILAFSSLVNASTGMCGRTLAMTGRPRLLLFDNILILFINLILSILLIPQYGLIGAAVANSISIISVNVLRVLQVVYYIKINPYNMTYIKPLIAGIISFVCIFYLAHIISFWIISAVLFAMLYLSLLIAFRLSKEEIYLLKAVKNKFFMAR